MGFTFSISSENKDPVTRHYLKLIVFGWSGHLDGSQWDHSFRVDILKHKAGGTPQNQVFITAIRLYNCSLRTHPGNNVHNNYRYHNNWQ